MKKALKFVSLLLGLAVSGCISPRPTGSPSAPAEIMPLATYTQRAVLVLPLQQIVEGTGRAIQATQAAIAAREEFNHEIRFAFGEAPPERWTFGPQIISASRRNIGISADPMKLAIESMADRLPELESSISETLRTQVRQIVALTDARYVLLPVTLRILPPDANGQRRASLRVVLIDARLALVRWAGDVSSDPSLTANRASASVASNLARLAGVR